MNELIIKEKFQNLNYERIYFYLIIIFAFSMPLSRAMISFFIILLPFVWIIERDYKRKIQQITNSKLMIILLSFYLLLIVSLSYSTNLDVGLNILNKYSYWIVIIVIATSLKKKYINNVITAFLLGMLVSEIIAYGVFFDLWTWKENTKYTMSPFMMHIDYSVFLAFSSILIFNRLISRDYNMSSKIVMFIFFLSTTINLFLSIGRTGQVAYIAGIIVMFFLYYRISIRSVLYSFITIIIIYFSAFNFSETFQKRVFHATNDIVKIFESNYNSSWGIRVAYWIISYDIVKENPLLGVGIGSYFDATLKTVSKDNFKEMSSIKEYVIAHHFHNQFLMILVATGILGVAVFIYFIFQVFKVSYNIKNIEHRNILVLFFVIFWVACLAEPLLIKQFTNSLWILFLGIVCLYDIENKNKEV